MMYDRILEAYRGGQRARDIARGVGLKTDLVLEILADAGEACAECGILFREMERCGVAEVGGRRVCQDCVEFLGLWPDRWLREPEEKLSAVEICMGSVAA